MMLFVIDQVIIQHIRRMAASPIFFLCLLCVFTASVSATQTVTSVIIESSSGSSQTPVTFGQVFVQGDVAKGQSLRARLKNGTPVPLQTDIKARYPDGSIKHAILSTQVNLSSAKRQALLLSIAEPRESEGKGILPDHLIRKGFKAEIGILADHARYTASPLEALKAGRYQTWLQGPLCTEWIVRAPFKTVAGFEHPHLIARFNIRAHRGLGQVRVSTIVENNWTYQPKPRHLTYDVYTAIGDDITYAQTKLTHYHHARWRKVFWWGRPYPQDLHIRHDTAYLVASGAIPNYDLRLTVPVKTLFQIRQQWREAKTAPMDIGFAKPYMPATGAHDDIGALPLWTVRYLLSMNAFAREAALGTDELAGSWPVHYRDKKTDLPVSIETYPHISTHANMQGKGPHPIPACQGDCKTPHVPDTAHQPSFSYVPYMLTGDFYHLEELHFWANWNLLGTAPGFREHDKGLVSWQQVRGQAWSLRTLGYAAFITPDAHPLKSYWQRRVQHNLDHYNRTYSHNPKANRFHIVDNYMMRNKQDQTSPWMDDFFTWTTGQLTLLGFAQAKPLLDWKAKFVVDRMTDPGYCWIYAAEYRLKFRDNGTAPMYTSMKQLFRKNYAPEIVGQPCGSSAMVQANNSKRKIALKKTNEMAGYASYEAGFPANMQPALAAAADSGIPGAKQAWLRFDSRASKPDYGAYPNWAIIPRTVSTNMPSSFVR